MTSLGIHTRLWFDQFEDIEGIPNPRVALMLNGSQQGRKISLKQMCSFLSHSNGMWFKPIQEGCSGLELIVSVPIQDSEGNRYYELNLKSFACGVSAVVSWCPECAGKIISITLDRNGLPVADSPIIND